MNYKILFLLCAICLSCGNRINESHDSKSVIHIISNYDSFNRNLVVNQYKELGINISELSLSSFNVSNKSDEDSIFNILFYNDFRPCHLVLYFDSIIVFSEKLTNNELNKPIYSLSKKNSIKEIGIQVDNSNLVYLNYDTSANYLRIMKHQNNVYVNFQDYVGVE